MLDVPETPEPPMVLRVEDNPPLVIPSEPKLPQPGFLLLAVALTVGYWGVLIGSMLAFCFFIGFGLVLFGEKGALEIPPGADSADVRSFPSAIRAGLAWSFPAGYLAGLVYSLFILRRFVGRHWVRELGLMRLPLYHFGLALIALPGFMICSNFVGELVKPIDGIVGRISGIGGAGDPAKALGAIFQDFHWSFAVFAVGIGPGVVEELWCRGFLGRGLIARYGWVAGIALSSMFFGMLHLWPPSYVIVTAVMGAGLHFAYITSRSLWVPIAMHLVNNAFAVLGSMQVIPTGALEETAAPTSFVIAAACLLLFCGLAMWYSRWTWAGEIRGVLLPPKNSDAKLTAARPDLIYTIAAIGFCATLIGLFCV